MIQVFLQRRLNLYALVARPFGYIRCLSAYIFSFFTRDRFVILCTERINLSLGRMMLELVVFGEVCNNISLCFCLLFRMFFLRF